MNNSKIRILITVIMIAIIMVTFFALLYIVSSNESFYKTLEAVYGFLGIDNLGG